jgi:mRNA-degrading endonuclease RelE of RelBE toxin-antitoxin system
MGGYDFILKPSAVSDLDRLRRYDAAMILDGIEVFLSHEPARESKSRIKRLRGQQQADYRLRLGDYRVFYTVDREGQRVDVLRVLHKRETQEFYEETQP